MYKTSYGSVKMSESLSMEKLFEAGARCIVTCIWFSCTHLSLFDLYISSWLVGLALHLYRIHRICHQITLH